jgi:alkanesulfonate monooxygenase SsuD/methylene tetrahydromethanopterin reductase-like flavin-dependent oxidoreductase (luciferase family)
MCEDLGYDSVWAYDHLSPYWIKTGDSMECWTLLSAIAERTSTIRIGSLVTNVNLRNPALLAKMSSTVDNISKGRLIVGLGTGDSFSRKELLSNGFMFSDLEERIERLRETICVLRAMWSEDAAHYQGRYYRLFNAINYPKPRQHHCPPIWIGGKHDKILDVVAEMADGWNYWGVGRTMLKRRIQYLSSRCNEHKRPIESIVKSWSGQLPPLTNENGDCIEVRNLMQELRDASDSEVEYFIASFDARSHFRSYEIFADAVRSLR